MVKEYDIIMSDKEQHRSVKRYIAHVIGILFAAVVFEVFLILSLFFFQGEWNTVYYVLALVGGSVINAVLLTLDLVFYFLHKETLYKFCITAYVLIDFFAICFYILLKTGLYSVLRSEDSLEAYLEKAGPWMAVLFIVLQFLQVVILPIPSTITVVAGSVLFGPLLGSIYSLIGIVLGSLVAFIVGRYAGYKVVAWLIGKETLDKWLKKVKGKDKLMLSAMFLLPVFPDDVLCFVAGLSSMSIWFFLAVIVISRVLAIFTTSYSITIIPLNTWWGILTWAILIALVIALLVILYKKSDVILNRFEKFFHLRPKKKEQAAKDGGFHIEVIDADGNIRNQNEEQAVFREESDDNKK